MNNEIMPKTESDVKRMASIAMAVAVSAFTSVFADYSVKVMAAHGVLSSVRGKERG